jgi:hypothetical protein
MIMGRVVHITKKWLGSLKWLVDARRLSSWGIKIWIVSELSRRRGRIH